MSKRFFCLIILSIFFYLHSDEIYTVQRGDNLSKIAAKFNTSIGELRSINGLSSDQIREGQKIIVKKPSEETPLYYNVLAGDNLTTIARKHHTTTAQLINWNSLKSSNIRINQKLIIGYETPLSALSQSDIKENEINDFHIVKRGETLTAISRRYDIDLVDLIEINKLTSFIIKPGQRLSLRAEQTPTDSNTTQAEAVKHTVLQGENLYRIALHYGVSIDDIRKWNNLSNSNIRVGQILEIQDTSNMSNQPISLPLSRIHNATLPVTNVRILSEFGMRDRNMHKGIDFAGNPGDPIYAVLPGTIVFSGVQRGYGNVIIIEHQNYIMTVYGHNESNRVSVGDKVAQRQMIATIGNTGNTTAFHLHFEYRVKGVAQNPRELLPIR